MANSPLLGFVELAEAQAIPATSANRINRYLEAMGNRAICVDDGEDDPTAADDSDGNMYLVPSGASGAWTGWADSLALAIGGTWVRILPRQGVRAYIISGPSEVEYDGANWGTPASTSLALDDLTDVDATAPSDGDVLTWNAGDSEWQAVAPTGGGSGASTTQDDEMIAGFIGTPADKSYTIALKMAHPGTITETVTKSVSGTCTATFKVNSTALGGTANSVSSAEQSQSHGSTNTFAAGDDIVLTISSNSSCADMSFSIKYTRTLD